MTTITRNTDDGTLHIEGAPGNPQKVPAALRGGTYDLFFAPGGCSKSLAHDGRTDPILVPYAAGELPCQKAANRSKLADFVPWAEAGNDFVEFFGAMQTTGCNFVRVFLSLNTHRDARRLLNRVPYRWELRNGRIVYDVEGAVAGDWDVEYFKRLTAFVKQASEHGVVVQLSLFNYFGVEQDDVGVDFRSPYSKFAGSPFNYLNSLNRDWGETNLLKLSDGNPHWEFIKTREMRGKLWKVQHAFVRRVMRAVSPYRNVVLELMNEPHATATREDIMNVARFNSSLVDVIKDFRERNGTHALISVNATYRIDRLTTEPAGLSDMEMWGKPDGPPHFDEVDIVSYHALTALPRPKVKVCNDREEKVESVDAESVALRASNHDRYLRKKALLYSTDAVLSEPFTHTYRDEDVPEPDMLRMLLRDGQIDCSPNNENRKVEELTMTHVLHWAKKCLAGNVGTAKGRFHFQNQSTFHAALLKVGQAAAALGL